MHKQFDMGAHNPSAWSVAGKTGRNERLAQCVAAAFLAEEFVTRLRLWADNSHGDLQ